MSALQRDLNANLHKKREAMAILTFCFFLKAKKHNKRLTLGGVLLLQQSHNRWPNPKIRLVKNATNAEEHRNLPTCRHTFVRPMNKSLATQQQQSLMMLMPHEPVLEIS